jgi:hypothetical protein
MLGAYLFLCSVVLFEIEHDNLGHIIDPRLMIPLGDDGEGRISWSTCTGSRSHGFESDFKKFSAVGLRGE